MHIHWDTHLLQQMREDKRELCEAAKSWILANAELAAPYVNMVEESHPAVWFSRVMTLVEQGIKRREQAAVELGCRFVLDLSRAPFGKILKSNILARLKSNCDLIDPRYIGLFNEILQNWQMRKYPPRETKDLRKLLALLARED